MCIEFISMVIVLTGVDEVDGVNGVDEVIESISYLVATQSTRTQVYIYRSIL